MSKRFSVAGVLMLAMVLFSFSTRGLAELPGLRFLDEGVVVREVSRQDMAGKLPVSTLTVENPSSSRSASYQGVSLPELLTYVYGERWKKAGLVKLETSDGYQPVIPVEVISKHQGLIAFADAGANQLQAIADGHGSMVDPGPYYLVWENLKDTSAKQDPWLQWPWQLVKIELTRMDREYPHTAPPEGSTDQVMRGFNGFLSHCSKCHQINGEGGNVGPELNYPVNVTEYWREDWLPKFIANPQSIRHNSKMVPYGNGSAGQQSEIEAILSYLKAMASRKQAPVGH